MNVPSIGQKVTSKEAMYLATWLGLDSVATKIRKNITNLKPFYFDGMSCVPRFLEENEHLRRLTRIPALKHDLRHYCGDSGDENARLQSNAHLYWDVIDRGRELDYDPEIVRGIAELMRTFTNMFSGEKWKIPGAFWGFGWKEEKADADRPEIRMDNYNDDSGIPCCPDPDSRKNNMGR